MYRERLIPMTARRPKAKQEDPMGSDKDLVTLSKTEFELVKSKLVDLPKKPFERIMAIAKAVHESGISEDRLTDVFYELCKRL